MLWIIVEIANNRMQILSLSLYIYMFESELDHTTESG